MPKKRGRSVEGRRKVTKRRGTKNAARHAVRASDDIELWSPAVRNKPKTVGDSKTLANRPVPSLKIPVPDEVPVTDLFIAPSQSKLTNRELGFDAKGRCLFGCDGMRSIKKGYTNIACHHYKCAFWETVDGKTKTTPF